MPAAVQPPSSMLTIEAATKASANGTVTKHPAAAQRQTLRIFAFGSQHWTPEAIAGIVFGILMFLLGVVALWQTRNQKFIFVGDIESYARLPDAPRVHIIETDPNLWVPPYEPPQDFLCISDPPFPFRALGGGDQKPALKPKPVPLPPQPKDGYAVELDLADMLPDTMSSEPCFMGRGPKQPAPKPEPKPKPPQPRDGYGLAKTTVGVQGKGGGQPTTKPDPKPPQPVDGYCVEPWELDTHSSGHKPRCSWVAMRLLSMRSTLSKLGMVVSYKFVT